MRRLDDALRRMREGGWHANVYTGDECDERTIRDTLGFELPIFVELCDVLLSMWKSTVFLRPLTHRFLRGAVQLVGRMLAFVWGGLEGEIEFGGSVGSDSSGGGGGNADGEEKGQGTEVPTLETTIISIPSYPWNERVEDIAVVSWELTILDTSLSHDYLEVIANTVCPQKQTQHPQFDLRAGRDQTPCVQHHAGIFPGNRAARLSLVECPYCGQSHRVMLFSAISREGRGGHVSHDESTATHAGIAICRHNTASPPGV